MNERITLDMLTEESVSVKKQQYVEVESVEYPIGQPHRKAYVNSTEGRSEIMDELPQPQQDAIFAIWGESATVVPDE